MSESVAVATTSSAAGRRSLVWFLLLTLAYLLAEVIYNVGVVRMLSTPGLSKETVEGMETVGKAMASIGITLFISRLIALRKLRYFVAVALALFIGLGMAVDRFVDSIPAEGKIAGHWLGVYRAAVLERKVNNPELFRPLAAPLPEQRIALVNIALLSKTQQDDIQRVGEAYVRKKVSNAYGDDRMKDDFSKVWHAYSQASSQLHPYWARYHARHPQRSVMDFMREVQLPVLPNVHYQRYLDTVIYPGNRELGLAEVRFGDVPLFKSRAQLAAEFRRMRANGQQTAVDHYLPNESNSEAALTRDFAASVFIPPISMTLSLFSILLNMASAVGVGLILVFTLIHPLAESASAWALRGVSMATFVLLFVLARSQPFPDGGKFATAYEQLSNGATYEWVWKTAIARERFVLDIASGFPTLIEYADALPAFGQKLGKF